MSATMHDPAALVQEARIAFSAGEVEHARHLCEQVIDVRTDHAAARRLLARIATGLDQPESAIEHWLVLRDARPDILETDLRLGRLYRDLDRWPEAIEAYERAAVAMPGNPEADRRLAELRALMQPCATPAQACRSASLMGTISLPATPEIRGLDRVACARLARAIGVPVSDAEGEPDTATRSVVVVAFSPPDTAGAPSSTSSASDTWLDFHRALPETHAGDGSTVFVALDAFERQPAEHGARLCELLGLPVPAGGPPRVSSVDVTYSRVDAPDPAGDGVPPDDEAARVHARLMQCYRRDFEIVEARIVATLDTVLTGSEVPGYSVTRRDIYLAGALDGERRLRLRVRTLAGNPRTRVQAQVLARVLERIDWVGYRGVQAFAFRDQGIRDYRDLLKYLDIDTWLSAKYRTVGHLGLIGTAPQRILDLGMGPGHFPLLCRELGHEVVGVDIDCSKAIGATGGLHMYDRLVALFGLERHTHSIRRFTPLPALGPRFDLVTALMARFNGSGDRMWGTDEWRYFLDDLVRNVLLEDGRVYLKLNDRSLSAPVVEQFVDLGAVVNMRGHTIRFDDTVALRAGLR